MRLTHSTFSMTNNNSRTTNSTSIASDMYSRLMMIDKNTHKFRHMTMPSQLSEIFHKSHRKSCQSNNCSVDIHPMCTGGIQLSTRNQRYIFCSEHKHTSSYRTLLTICRNMRHEG